MRELIVSSKGQIVLPADLRRRLGMGAGAKLEIIERADGVTLRLVSRIEPANVSELAGMAKAPSRGRPRRLEDFDAAAQLSRNRRS